MTRGRLLDMRPFLTALREVTPVRCVGSVQQVVGLTMETAGLHCEVGELCTVHTVSNHRPLRAEVVGFRGDRALLMPLGEMQGVRPGSSVDATGAPFSVPVGDALLGRVVDALGHPIDRKGPVVSPERRRITTDATPDPLTRISISEPLTTGVRAIDGLLTVGRGQRVGIFAGSGVGKSTLLGMIARNSNADVSVIGLVGERGREVREFIERDLGEEGLRRSVVIVSTSDQPALLRLKGSLAGHGGGRAFPGAGPARDADDGQHHPFRYGPARDWSGYRGAASGKGLHAFGLRAPAETP